MKYNNLSMIFGIFFAIGLGVLAYLSFILALVLSFVGVDWFVIMMIVFAALAIATLIGAVLARKKVMTTIVINCISLAAVLFVIVYLLVMNVLTSSPMMIFVFGGVFAIGLLSLLFAILAKKKQSNKEVKDIAV